MKRLTITWMLLLLLAGSIRAEPLDLSQIPAETTWVAHVDLDALRVSETVRQILTSDKDLSKAQLPWERIRRDVGIDVVKDAHGVTLFGERLEPGQGAGIVHARFDREQLLGFMTQRHEYVELTIDGHTVHRWTVRQHEHERPVFVCLPGDDRIVFSGQQEDLTRALAILDGKVDPPTTSPLSTPPNGAVLWVEASGLGESPLGFRSPLWKQTESLRLVLGESQGKIFLRLDLLARSEEDACELQGAAGMAKAMAVASNREKPVVRGQLRRVMIQREGSTMVIAWSAPVEEVLALLKQCHQQK